MKRAVLALMIIFFSFYFGGEVFAAGYKPPSAICLNLVGRSNDMLTLTIKAAGKATMADGSTQFYAINGVYFPPDWETYIEPLAGTGYMSKGQYDRIFNFAVTGSGYDVYASQFRFDILGLLDVVTGSGYIKLRYDYFDSDSSLDIMITAVDCKELTIPPLVFPIPGQ